MKASDLFRMSLPPLERLDMILIRTSSYHDNRCIVSLMMNFHSSNSYNRDKRELGIRHG